MMLLAMKTLKCYGCISVCLFVTVKQSFNVSQIDRYQSFCRHQFRLGPSISRMYGTVIILVKDQCSTQECIISGLSLVSGSQRFWPPTIMGWVLISEMTTNTLYVGSVCWLFLLLLKKIILLFFLSTKTKISNSLI